MAVDIKFLIDGADRGQPTNAEDFGFTIGEDTTINSRIVSFNNDLTFVGGVFDYIYSNLIDTGGCSLINVQVQYLCGGVWKRLTNGYIVVSECVFNLDRCSLTTKLYDDSFSTKINNNKSIPFPLNSLLTKNLNAVVPPTIRKVMLYRPSNGVYQYPCYGVSIYDAFKHLVSCMSDNLVDFDSNYFDFNFANDGNFDLVTNGLSIINATQDPTIVSFVDLFTALNKKLRLGMVIEVQPNQKPLLRIEPADYFNQQGVSVNLYNQPDISLKYDTAQQYASINFGSTPFLEQHECNNGQNACTFFQDSFRGFREETFGLIGECNTSNVLGLNSDKIVFDTNVIEDTYVYNNENYNNSTFVIQSFWDVSANQGLARKFDPYNINQYVYNGDYTNEKTAINWIGGYPNGIYSYIQGFTPTSTQVRARSNSSPLQQWVLGGDGFFTPKYSGGPTSYVAFANELIDPSNNFNVTKYTIPYTAEYTFSATVIGNASLGADLGYYSMIVRSNSIGGVLDSYSDFIPVLPHGFFNDTCVTTVQWTTICNQGDVVTVNIFGGSDVGGFGEILNSWLDVETDITYYTQFDAIGTPFPSVLQPVDPNSIIRLIYSFERPLTMNEIEAILDNTSKPISFGSLDDPLRVIKGYIKKVDVKSIIEQEASFELKSNKILR